MIQQFWEFIAGLGLFLFAMHIMESSLKALAGRSFKLFLRKYTSNTLGAITSGAVVTGILQSSSVVILTILSFVGAGIVTMRNALAVTIGSNFGTTIDSWLVASVGFKVDIDIIALPLVGVAAISLAFLAENSKAHSIFRFLLGFGFLFMGLGLMKDGMSEIFKDLDFSLFANYPRIVFVGIGFLMTALIQSSSAAMAIFLSALNTGVIPFEAAVAAVIGSELATTIKIVLGSIGGVAAKWQLSVGNVLFNLAICTIAFIFMDAYMWLSETIAGSDPLFRLVAFQSCINLAGVFLIAPFLKPFSDFLEKYVKGNPQSSAFVVDHKLINSEPLAMDALKDDVQLLLHRVLHLNLLAFGSDKKWLHADSALRDTLHERDKKLKTFELKYDDIKKAEGEILSFALKLKVAYPQHSERIDTFIDSVRHAMHSAKAMKDVMHNRIEFRESADDVKFNHYIDFRNQLEEFYSRIDEGISKGKHPSLSGLIELSLSDYNQRLERIYDAAARKKLDPEDVSSLLNVNRELYTSCKTIIQALQLYYESSAAKEIGVIP